MSFHRVCCCSGQIFKLSRCGSSEIIYTKSDMSAYVGSATPVVKIGGICYGVTTVASGTPIQAVSVTSAHATCAACGATANPCNRCVEGTFPENDEMQAVVSGITLCTGCYAGGGFGEHFKISGTTAGTYSLDVDAVHTPCGLVHETTDYPITLTMYAAVDIGCLLPSTRTERRKLKVRHEWESVGGSWRRMGLVELGDIHPDDDVGATVYSVLLLFHRTDLQAPAFDCNLPETVSSALASGECGAYEERLTSYFVAGYGGQYLYERV